MRPRQYQFCICAMAYLAGCMAFSGCNRSQAGKGPPTPPPAEVTVAKPITQMVRDYREYTGRTAAIESVEIRSRVSGYLQPVRFKEGADVKIGDLLFQIDPRPYQETIRQAEANLSAQRAQLERFQLDLTRARELISSNAISQADLDLAIANFSSGKAQLQSLEASLARAQLDLEYTEIRSPIAGRTSRALVTAGNLVVADQTILTSVVSMNPIFAYFDIDEGSALDYRQRVRQSQVASARDTTIAIELGLSNEQGHPHQGEIDFVDNVTDVGTGNISVRGRFNNDDGALIPGLFARIRVPFTREYEALLLPQAALAMNQQGRFVLTVNSENKIVPKMVQVGTTHGDLVAIRSGIAREDTVVVAGLQKARPGSVVKPVPLDKPQSTAASSATEPSAPASTSADSATSGASKPE